MKKSLYHSLWALAVLLAGAPALTAEGELSVAAESGFLAVPYHTIRYAADEPRFSYPEEGGQDRLFPFLRLSVDLEIDGLHTFTFLYQPLEIESRVETPASLVIDGESFSGETLRVLYSFPFYRFSYMRRIAGDDRWRIDGGLSLQIRNAGIEFEAADGSAYVRRSDIGPVPLLKLRGRYSLSERYWLGAEIDGIYAPISYLNGSDNETTGALLDASLRGGRTIGEDLEAYLNLRYLGGGAANTDPEAYTENWLQILTVSLGARMVLR